MGLDFRMRSLHTSLSLSLSLSLRSTLSVGFSEEIGNLGNADKAALRWRLVSTRTHLCFLFCLRLLFPSKETERETFSDGLISWHRRKHSLRLAVRHAFFPRVCLEAPSFRDLFWNTFALKRCLRRRDGCEQMYCERSQGRKKKMTRFHRPRRSYESLRRQDEAQ